MLEARIDPAAVERLPFSVYRRSPWNLSDMSVRNKTYHNLQLTLRVEKSLRLAVIALVFMGLVSRLFHHLRYMNPVSKANVCRL